MVLGYSYLWNREANKGETSGRKNRPTAIVLVRTDVGPGEMVYVVPITHSEPANGDDTKILIPQSIKQRLGLDEDRSWVDVTEYNVFVWPGHDLQPVKRRASGTPAAETCLYGFLPSKFFEKLRQALNDYRLSNKPGLVRR
jgi:hypothetical protein